MKPYGELLIRFPVTLILKLRIESTQEAFTELINIVIINLFYCMLNKLYNITIIRPGECQEQ
jgi:hypothetical protein